MDYTYGVSSDALNRIEQKLRQKRAMGGVVEPWELEAAYKAALGTAANQASNDFYKNKALNAETSFRNKQLALQKEQIDASEKASMMGGIGELGLTSMWGLNKFFPSRGAGEVASTAPYLASEATAPILSNTASLYSAAPTTDSLLSSTATDFGTGLAVGTEGPAGIGALTTEGAGASGLGLSSFAAPAVAGAVAPGLVDSLHKDSMENLGHNATLGLVRDEDDARSIGGALTGAAAGALIGGPPGAVIGGALGSGRAEDLALGAIVGGPVGGILGAEKLFDVAGDIGHSVGHAVNDVVDFITSW